MANARIIATRTGDDAHFDVAGETKDIMALAMACLIIAKRRAKMPTPMFKEYCRILYKAVSKERLDPNEETK